MQNLNESTKLEQKKNHGLGAIDGADQGIPTVLVAAAGSEGA